jgi:hypothetical protein
MSFLIDSKNESMWLTAGGEYELNHKKAMAYDELRIIFQIIGEALIGLKRSVNCIIWSIRKEEGMQTKGNLQ